jgi:hypothetical protein
MSPKTNEQLEMETKRVIGDLQSELSNLVPFHNYRQQLLYANEVGSKLRKLKTTFKHGTWQPWIDKNFPHCRSIASCYMRIAKNWNKVSHCNSVSEALRLISDLKRKEKDES